MSHEPVSPPRRWWETALLLAPILLVGAALTGGISLLQRGGSAGFDGREIVGEAGLDYVLASGVALLAPWFCVVAAATAILWSLARRVGFGPAQRHDLIASLGITLSATALIVAAVLWFAPGKPDESRVVLDTGASFCAEVVLRTPSRVYARVETRGLKHREGADAATSFAADKVLVVSAPPRVDCGDVSVDKLGGTPPKQEGEGDGVKPE